MDMLLDSFYRSLGKRFMDVIIGLIGILLALPILFIVSFCWFIYHGSFFFIQKRVGKNGKPFCLYKLKTMTDDVDKDGVLLKDSLRLTKMGLLIRSLSLDELPQLINVLRGDMSIIGPRPLLVDYLPYYTQEQEQRHQVKPGITGWAQVNGRNTISWEEKFEFDVFYVKNCSLFLDMKILVLTVWKIVGRTDITPMDIEIMPRFDVYMKNK